MKPPVRGYRFGAVFLFFACRVCLDELGVRTAVRGLPDLAACWLSSACDVACRRCDVSPESKPKWEFPRLCRGGSKSLTYPGVDAADVRNLGMDVKDGLGGYETGHSAAMPLMRASACAFCNLKS